MSQTHNEFELAIQQLGFRIDYTNEYDWTFYDGTWFYKLKFEGYAYVLYKNINIYVTPMMNLFRIFNKFRSGTAQIGLHYAVPIAHFRDPKKLKTIMGILTDKLDDDDDELSMAHGK